MGRGRAGLGILIAAAAACSGAGPRPVPGAPAAAKTAAPRPPSLYPTPARWAVHPSPLSYATAMLRLADGRCLLTEQSGQRWLTSPHRGPVTVSPYPYDADWEENEGYYGDDANTFTPNSCSGDGLAAVDRAPEAIVGIFRRSKSYGFVGESGTIHETKLPLGPFVRRIAPPEPFHRVRGSGSLILGVTATGRLFKWDGKEGYERVDLGGAHAFDAAVAPGGRAVVLAAPEAIFTTEDGGAHFTRATVPSIGVQRAGYPAGGPFLIEGAVGSLAWDPREPPTFVKTHARIPEPRFDVSIEAGRSPTADAVSSGRAVIDGDHYWEIGAGNYDDWSLYKGRLDGRLTSLPLPTGNPQENSLTMAARDRHVAIGILSWTDDGPNLEVRVSHDGGLTFRGTIPLSSSQQASMGLSLSLDGTLLITGACPRKEGDPTSDPDSADESESCPGGPLLLREGGAVVAPRVPALGGPALSPAFSTEGKSAYFLAQRESDNQTTLFVSHDGGASFEERVLEVKGDDSDTTFEMVPETIVTVSESGTVGMVLEASGEQSGPVYVTTNEDGRRPHIGVLPPNAALTAGFGERVLSVGQSYGSSSDSEGTPVWESLDGGESWFDVPSPAALRDAYRRRGELACGAAGCLIGDDVTRLGWGGQTDSPLPFEQVHYEPPPRDLRTAITCEPKAGSTWTRINDVSSSSLLPDEHEAARGRTAWLVPTLDPQTNAVSVVSATLPEGGDGEARISTAQVLAPMPKGSDAAISLLAQIEGIAVARAPIASGVAAAGATAWSGRRIKNLEIAWTNLEEGTTGHAVVPDAGAFQRGTIYVTNGRSILSLQMLSVSPKGIFLRTSAADNNAYFIDTAGKMKAFTFPDWPPDLTGNDLAAGDAVNVDGSFVLTTQLGGRSSAVPETLFLGHPRDPKTPEDAPWTPWAATLLPAGDFQQRRYTHTDWTYEGGHLVVVSLHTVPDAGYAAAWSRRVQADGTLAAPLRLPTPYDLGATPRPCSAAEHKDLARLRFSLDDYGRAAFPGARHPVIVTELGPAPLEDSPEAPQATREDDIDLDEESEPADPKAKAKPKVKKPKPPAKPRGPLPIGRAALLTSGVILRGTPSSPCVDAFAARGIGHGAIATLMTGDLRYAWFFRMAPPREAPKKGAATTAAGLRDIEVRPLSCRFDPGARVPEAIDFENQTR